MTRAAALFVVTAIAVSSPTFAQTPQPFPRPGEPAPPQRPAAPPVTTPPTAAPPAAPRTAPPATGQAAPAADPAAGGLPVYPSAQMIGSYDAGRGQRYVLYGTTASFVDTVTYYRTQLDEKGTLVFKEPPTHMFEV